MGLSPAQLAQRLEGISATDVSAIVGVNPHRSRIQVWQEKRGEAPPWEDTERTKWGNLLEPVIRSDYEDRHGVRVDVPGTLTHPDRPWMMATPDGVRYPRGSDEPERGLEIKCHTWRVSHLYGSPGTDEIPLWELCQVAWNLGVTGLDRWDLVAFIDGQPQDYTIDRDDDLIDGLIEQCERFLVDNVRGGAVPEPDGSEGFDAWLKSKWKAEGSPLIDIGDDVDTFTLIERARELRGTAADLEAEHMQIIQKLKLRIGAADGLTWKDAKGKVQRITWKRSKPTRRTDHAGALTDVKNHAGLTAAGVDPDVKRAMVCLRSAGEHTPIGTSSQATITAGEVAKLITDLHAGMREIASRQAAVTELPGNRPFCFPRSWKAPASAKED